MSCWTYDVSYKANGEIEQEVVTYRGNGASVNMKDYSDYNGKLYTSCSVKMEFVITPNKNDKTKSDVNIYPYLDGVKMNIQDGKHGEQNKKVLEIILQQLYGGVQEE